MFIPIGYPHFTDLAILCSQTYVARDALRTPVIHFVEMKWCDILLLKHC